MMRPYSIFALMSMFVLQTSNSLAQDSEEEDLAVTYSDRMMISIATGSKQTLRRAPAVTSVITAEDIATMGATDLDQVLETVPGMHVSYLFTYQPQWGMRGAGVGTNTAQVLLLQNGIPMTTAFTGGKGQWNGLPLEHIARIEIIRGPASALYGSDAFSGVINIITKTAADIQGTEVGSRIGNNRTRDAWLLHGGKLGPVNMAAYLRVGASDGIHEIIQTDNASGRGAKGAPNPSFAPGPVHAGYDAIDGNLDLDYGKWRLRAGYKQRYNAGTGAGVGQALDPVGKAYGRRITSDLSWSDPQFAQDWSVGWTASYLSLYEGSNVQLFPPGIAFGPYVFPDGVISIGSRWQRDFRLESHAVYSGLPNQTWRIGAGHDDINLYRPTTSKNYVVNDPTGATSNVFNPALPAGVLIPLGQMTDQSCAPPVCQPHILPHRRKINYVYAQDEWRVAPDWTFTGGARYDYYSDVGGTFNPRAALVWNTSLELTSKLLFGRAFRAPSFNAQYGINPVAGGNPHLKPESTSTWEVAFSWHARRDLLVNLNFFRYDTKDIISTTPVIDPVTQKSLGATYSNVGRQHGNGMELELAWDASKNLRLSGNYAYQRSIDETTNTDAGYLPHHHIYARADVGLGNGWMMSAQANWIGDRKRSFGDTRPDIANYTTVDLTLRSNNREKNQWNFAASIRNLFNADTREPTLAPGTALPYDLPVTPRTLYVQASYRF